MQRCAARLFYIYIYIYIFFNRSLRIHTSKFKDQFVKNLIPEEEPGATAARRIGRARYSWTGEEQDFLESEAGERAY